MKQNKEKQSSHLFDHFAAEAKEYLEGWKRSKADFANREREYEKQRAEFQQFATAQCLQTLFPVFESLERALATCPEELTDNEWTEGIRRIRDTFWKTLSDYGVEKIEAIGKRYDPMLHEVVARRTADEAADTIVEEVAPGYRLKGRMLTPAKVIIAE